MSFGQFNRVFVSYCEFSSVFVSFYQFSRVGVNEFSSKMSCLLAGKGGPFWKKYYGNGEIEKW